MRIYEFEKEKKKERKRGGSELSSLSKEIVPIKCKAAPRLSVKMITVFGVFWQGGLNYYSCAFVVTKTAQMLLRFFHVCFNLFQYNMQRKLPNLQKTKSVPYSRYLFSDFILSSLTEKSV
jgi:hypothetical protein